MDYNINNDFFDEFPVLFAGSNSVLAGVSAPLGSHAAEALDADTTLWMELTLAVHAFRSEFDTFLHARSPTAAAVAQERLDQLWALLGRLPVYRHLHTQPSGAGRLMAHLQACPQEMDEILTPGTERHRAVTRWLARLDSLVPSLQTFRRDVGRMLDDHFTALPSRRPSAYAEAYGAWRFLLADVLGQEEDEHDVSTAGEQYLRFPVRLSWKPHTDAAGRTQLAEQMYFKDLRDFLHIDLLKGMAAGNLPRRCAHCGRWFLAIGAYDTRYCSRIAPGETERTCRKVGAHRAEKAKSQSQPILRAYRRAYERLKGRKRNGKITEAEWNEAVARAQEVKEAVLRGELAEVEAVGVLEGM